jgi:glycosyltransferase involved in cell wall biosynthesis
MKKITLIRDLRKSAVEYYKLFNTSHITYVTGIPHQNNEQQIVINDRMKLVKLPVYYPTLIDPTKIIGSPYNAAWHFFKNCGKYIKDADIVGLQDTYYPYNYHAIREAKRNNKPVFTEIWCNIPNHISAHTPPYSWITNQIVKNTDLFILRNNKAYEFSDSIGIPREKTRMIYIGVDIEKFSHSDKSTSDSITILYVGRLLKSKGVVQLIEAFEKCCTKYKNIKLILAGDGPLKQYVVEKSQNTPIEYKGHVDYTKLHDLYNNADIFCSPSQETYFLNNLTWSEYFSYTLMEAQAAGLPIIATNTGGIPEELHNDNVLISPGSMLELFQAMCSMIESFSKRKEIGTKNREYAIKHFNAKIQAQELENVLNSYFKN